MKQKAGCNHGMVVDKDGNILEAWSWYSTPECPHEFEVPSGGRIIPLTPEAHDQIKHTLHLNRYDHASRMIVGKTR